MSDPIVWSAFTFQASFWLSLCVAPLCFSHYHRLDSTKGEKAYWAATFSGVLHAILIVALCVLALYDSPELMSSSNFFQGDTDWVQQDGHYVISVVETELREIRDTITSSLEEITRWRLSLDPRTAARFDRMTYAIVLTAEELLYFDTLPPVQAIRTGFGTIQTHVQQAVADRTARELDRDPLGLEASQ
eukprot:s599_g12.t1